jgi:FkbM family methyltransferase
MKIVLQELFFGVYKFLTNFNYRKFLYLAIVYGSRKRFRSTRISFLNYSLNVPDCQSFIWQFKEIFVDEYYRFESNLENPIIYDCGANVGTSCAYFKKLYPKARITAFEANPEIANILEENLRNNGIDDIRLLNKAVWVNSEGIEMGLESADASSIHMKLNRVKVESVRLRDYLEKEERIDMLKMDIEGAEVNVLIDCKENLSKVKNLFIEFHSYRNEKQRLSEIINILESNNFRYFIKQPEDRTRPFINRLNKSNPEIDLQLNIFAYRSD